MIGYSKNSIVAKDYSIIKEFKIALFELAQFSPFELPPTLKLNRLDSGAGSS